MEGEGERYGGREGEGERGREGREREGERLEVGLSHSYLDSCQIFVALFPPSAGPPDFLLTFPCAEVE